VRAFLLPPQRTRTSGLLRYQFRFRANLSPLTVAEDDTP